MRKRIITPSPERPTWFEDNWLNLKELAEVEITSEDPDHPIEAALLPGASGGWWAAEPGAQTIRLLFASAQTVSRVWLQFVETQVERSQEYVLRWSGDHGRSFQEIVRQQWNFSPQGATVETEDHSLHLPALTSLELHIIPDISGETAYACLEKLRLAG